MRYRFSNSNTKRVDYFKTCMFINVNVNGVWYWCEFSQWLSCLRWACITWQMCPPWPALRSETPRSGHQGRVTTAQYWPVLPNTRQFLTISKVIPCFTVAHWPRQQEAPSPSWRKVMETSWSWTELDTFEMPGVCCHQTGTRTPGCWIWDADAHLNIGCDAVYREGPGYHRSSSLNISKVATDKATQNHQLLGIFVHNKAIIHNFKNILSGASYNSSRMFRCLNWWVVGY